MSKRRAPEARVDACDQAVTWHVIVVRLGTSTVPHTFLGNLARIDAHLRMLSAADQVDRVFAWQDLAAIDDDLLIAQRGEVLTC